MLTVWHARLPPLPHNGLPRPCRLHRVRLHCSDLRHIPHPLPHSTTDPWSSDLFSLAGKDLGDLDRAPLTAADFRTLLTLVGDETTMFCAIRQCRACAVNPYITRRWTPPAPGLHFYIAALVVHGEVEAVRVRRETMGGNKAELDGGGYANPDILHVSHTYVPTTCPAAPRGLRRQGGPVGVRTEGLETSRTRHL